MQNHWNKRPEILLFLISLSLILCACVEQPKQVRETYIIKEISEKYRGVLVSQQTQKIAWDRERFDLVVSDGATIKAGDVVLLQSEKSIEKELLSLEEGTDTVALEKQKEENRQSIDMLKEGDYSVAPTIYASYKNLLEELADLEREIRLQEISLESLWLGWDGDAQGVSDQNYRNRRWRQYELDKESGEIQLKKLQDKKARLEEELEGFPQSEAVSEQIKLWEEEIKSCDEKLQAYAREKQRLETEKERLCAEENSWVDLQEDVILLHSQALYFRLTLSTANALGLLNNQEALSLYYQGDLCASLSLLYYRPAEADNEFELYYTLSKQSDSLLQGSYAYLQTVGRIILPEGFVGKREDGTYYALKQGVELPIEISIEDGETILLSGLEIGDEIEKIN